jgi:oligopeptide/dipeptide ABC transporter ATP-binding protein
MTGSLLEIEDLTVRYGKSGFPAVDGVGLTVGPGDAVGLVGESGSGKSTIGRAVLGLVKPTGGRIRFDGRDVTGIAAEDRAGVAADLQVVFQDPYGSLNPARTIRQILTEPLHRLGGAAASERVSTLLERVSLPADALDRYPAAFSGGQRQRIAIARALAISPKLVICDEPVSSLDVSTQAQVLNLLADLRAEFGLAYLFIGHDLAVVQSICDRVVVLYRGRVMETGPAAGLTSKPLHPYTRALAAATLVPDVAVQRQRREARLCETRSAARVRVPAGGCPFVGRCPDAEPVCFATQPALSIVGERTVACHMYDAASGHRGIEQGL